jgi:hypothetical protein
MTTIGRTCGAICAAMILGCGSDGGGTDTGAVQDAGATPQQTQTSFASSACKKSEAAKTHLARRYHAVIEDEAGLGGLRCVAWKRVGTTELKLDLYNFDGACGTTWVGDAAIGADGTIALAIDNPSCTVALCGKCLYDWSFDVQGAIPAGPVPVDITVNTCKGQQTPVQIPTTIGAEEEGLACSFADYGGLLWQASATSTCGTLAMPCVGSSLCGSGSFTSTGTCNTGLVCDSSAATNEPRCLAPCSTAQDCPRADAWVCQSGLCRPNAQPPAVLQ